MFQFMKIRPNQSGVPLKAFPGPARLGGRCNNFEQQTGWILY